MNIAKLLSPDFIIGKILISIKAIVDIALLVIMHPSKKSLSFAKLVFRVKPKFTMVRNENLRVLYDLVCRVDKLQLAGDIVECGVWNGGSAAIMGVALMEDPQRTQERTIWLFDSFRGLPSPGQKDGDFEKNFYFKGWSTGDAALVKEIFEKIGFPLEKIMIVPGWFDQTLKRSPVKDIVLLHIDADWYDSVKTALEAFFDRVVPGGFVVFDDYQYWQGCGQALTDFFSQRGIKGVSIERVGRQGAYFQKPSETELLSKTS